MEAVFVFLSLEAVPKTSNDVPDLFTDVRFADLSDLLLVVGAVDRVEIFSTVRLAGRDRTTDAFEEEAVLVTGLRSVRIFTDVRGFTATDGVITVRETEDVFDLAFPDEEAEEVRLENLIRFELLLFLSALLATSTVRFTLRAGTALLFCCAGCEGVC